MFREWFDIFFGCGEVAEDIQKYLRPTLENIPFNRVPSADTLHRVLKELATDNTTVPSVSDKDYKFNINEKMNDLNIKSLLLTKQLNKNEFYDFDYDNQIIAHNKYDSKRTYKNTKGYFPGIATIADKIVYIENRDGNANVKTGQTETLSRAYKLLDNNKIKVNRSRMDAGSYSKEIIDTVAKNSRLFYIRANRCTAMTKQISEINRCTFQVELPLNTLIDQLDPDTFFRANRQIIINIKSVVKIEPYFAGKISVTTQPKSPVKVIVSREKGVMFKTWLNY